MTESSAAARVIRMEAINNFRDYGDLPTTAGGRLRPGRLFRSAHHARATPADVARLAGLGLAMVTDLRHPDERAEQPNAWRGTLAIHVIETPVDAAAAGPRREAPHLAALRTSDGSAEAMTGFLAAHYRHLPYDPAYVSLYSRYFAALAERDGAMLIHCAAGKDRTGILAWLTHHLLGVHPDDAMADYLLSNTASGIAERLPHLRRRLEESSGQPIGDDAIMALLGVSPRFMANCLGAIDERSGSMTAYLEQVLGIDAARREAIRGRLVI
ncbi:tyrosine-protein phosphatase [Novosphingobium bradum]|uniref:Tyrosine-protein phosphatase n=1 Tax=Novosphingobium bradum TaxID=1737444 RepID=A0ABV7INX9_9SPHN